LLAEPLTALAVSGKQPQVRTLAVNQLYWLAPAVLLLAVSETLNAILAGVPSGDLANPRQAAWGCFLFSSVGGCFTGVLHSHVFASGFHRCPSDNHLGAGDRFAPATVCPFALRGQVALGARFLAVCGRSFLVMPQVKATLCLRNIRLTSFAAGMVSSFQYAVSLTNVLITLVGVTLANVLWPRFMEHAAVEDRGRLYSEVSVVSRLVFSAHRLVVCIDLAQCHSLDRTDLCTWRLRCSSCFPYCQCVADGGVMLRADFS